MARKLRPEELYARKVLKGKIPACEAIGQACQRFLDDLKHADERGWYFDDEAADLALEFFPLELHHHKGKWGRRTPEHPHGQPFELELWQKFNVGNVFGWKDAKTHKRRFSKWILWVPRKNGKSPLAAGSGLLVCFFEGEPEAEGYVAATKRAQAQVLHRYCAQYVRRSPELSQRLKIVQHNISDPSDESRIECLGADSEKQDGFSVAWAAVDEAHAMKDDGVFEVLDTGTLAREEPLSVVCTTPGEYRVEGFG